MVLFNVSAEDSSPLLVWGPPGAWNDSPENDTLSQSYSAQSWHTTSVQGATVTISFNGTGIWFYGANRPDYGSYTFAVDGQATAHNANASSAVFQQLLGGASSLPMGSHTAVLQTTSAAPVDLDSLIFETQIGPDDRSVSNSTIDDTDSRISYLPPSSWIFNPLPDTMNNTLHFTQTGGAQAQIEFSGDAVAVYGTVSSDHANYTIAVDGNAAHAFDGGSNGIASTLHLKTLLYFGNGLGPGQHNLVLTADPDQNGQNNTGRFMDIDAIKIYSTTSNSQNGAPSNSTGSPSSDAPDTSSIGKSGLPIAALAGIIAGIVVIVTLFVVAALLWRRRRNRIRDSKMPLQTPSTPSLPFHNMQPSPVDRENPFMDPSEKSPFDSGLPTTDMMRRPDIALDMRSQPLFPQAVVQPNTAMRRDGAGGGDLPSRMPNYPSRPARPPSLYLGPMTFER
ncbi:uncharacterized protein STEHIDRAFT_171157 [Stereum hirsutum FP-91666 SS1]|uniref:uncharacterized protein n=1 Tax=Stereum hirsutum (strain FP-91666) TaxID=721885 RepID=UPI0004449B8F|nr:uncharacterized protein STEHIDRAFT_171157 [Stereum hirsutum FP-91666 SS1]EIM83052.1 hypothetical protein STEHIDRAFT_171157 [Stereum hirsutum FP-91666 SS1]